jgi:hypothetical protein
MNVRHVARHGHRHQDHRFSADSHGSQPHGLAAGRLNRHHSTSLHRRDWREQGSRSKQRKRKLDSLVASAYQGETIICNSQRDTDF